MASRSDLAFSRTRCEEEGERVGGSKNATDRRGSRRSRSRRRTGPGSGASPCKTWYGGKGREEARGSVVIRRAAEGPPAHQQPRGESPKEERDGSSNTEEEPSAPRTTSARSKGPSSPDYWLMGSRALFCASTR